MLVWLSLSLAGFLLELLLQKYAKNSRVERWILVVGAIVLGLITTVYSLIGEKNEKPQLYNIANDIVTGFSNNLLLQIVAIILLLSLIIYFNSNGNNDFTFDKYSAIIQKFTAQSMDGSTIYLSAGDMDF